MKNKAMIFMILGLVLAIIAGVIIMQFHSKKQTDVGTFELTKYQWEIENFPSDKNVGQVNDSDTAIEKAKERFVLLSALGEIIIPTEPLYFIRVLQSHGRPHLDYNIRWENCQLKRIAV